MPAPTQPDGDENSVSCPGCAGEMNPNGFNGNYQEYTCPHGCNITLERLVTSDTGTDGMTMEALQHVSNFTNNDES